MPATILLDVGAGVGMAGEDGFWVEKVRAVELSLSARGVSAAGCAPSARDDDVREFRTRVIYVRVRFSDGRVGYFK
jgi:hypothetical protein